MLVYWQTTTNSVLSVSEYQTTIEKGREQIFNWACTELFLVGDLLKQFVEEKVYALKQTYLEISLPYSTFAECVDHVQSFYTLNSEIVNCFPNDRWVWVKKLESYIYSEYDYRAIKVKNRVIDCKLSEGLHVQ